MNKVILIGYMCDDPTASTTANGISKSAFRLAVYRKYKNNGKRESDFFNITAWRKTADYINSYLVRGCKILVEGNIQNRKFTAQDGSERWVTDIIAESVEPLGNPKEAAQNSADGQQTDGGQMQEVFDPELPWL